MLHGSSGVPDEELRQAVTSGMVKGTIGTALNVAFTNAIREFVAADTTAVDPRKYLAPARQAMARSVTRFIRLLAS